MAEEHELPELAEQVQGIRLPPHSVGLVFASVDVADGALQKAARDGQEDQLEHFLGLCTEGQIDALDDEGYAALHYAVKHHRVNIIKKLLAAKCYPDVLTKDDLTPLHIAACYLPRGSDTVTETEGANDAKSTSCEVLQMLLECDGKSVRDRLIADDSQGSTPLHMACSRANVPAVQELLKHIQEVDRSIVKVQDRQNDTPLHEACIHGNLPIVKELLKHGADVHAQNDNGKNPLQIACKGGYVEVVKAILDYNLKEAKELAEACVKRSKNTAMHFAVENRDVEMVKVLLGYEVDPSTQNDDKVAPIHIAAGQGYTDIARELLDCDDSCKDLLDKHHRSPLHYAAKNNQVEMIKLLLSMGCDKELLDKDSASPLLLSAKFGKAKAVQALISKGCELSTTDKNDKSAVYWAAQEGHTDVLRVLLNDKRGILLVHVPEPRHLNTPFHIAAEMGRAEAIKLLATHLGEHLQQLSHQLSEEREAIGENDPTATERLQTLEQERVEMEVLRLKLERFDFRNDEHKTPLHLASMSGKMEVVRLLVHKYSLSLTVKDNEGNTPLHLATLHGRTEVADVLIREGAEVDARNGLERTPLHLAAEAGHAEIVDLLIKADALLEAKDWGDNTPLFLACARGHLAAAKVLIHKGADVTAHVQDSSTTTKHNCLDVAVKNGHENVALAIIHSNQWEAALRHAHGQMTPFRRMIRQMPSAAEAVLDKCLSAIDEWSKDPILPFNYEFLDDYCDEPSKKTWMEIILSCFSSEDTEDKNKWGPDFSAKDHPLALMVRYKRDDLLRHPVVTSLLEYKWRRYGGAFFLFNLITFLTFLFFLTLYALLLPHPDHRFCHDFSVTQSVARLPMNGTRCPFESAVPNHSRVLDIDPTVPMNNHANVALYFAAVVVIISVFGRLPVELTQCLKTRCRYFQKFENYIEILAYISALIFVSHFGTNCWCPTNWQWQLGAFGVFLAWINLILFLKRVPLLGIYVLMFNAILHSFLKFALIAFLFVVAFCIAFYMILYKALDDATMIVNVSPFRNAGLSFIKTLVMTTGEFEYDSIFGHSSDSSSMLTSFPEGAYILWIIFLIVMPILLTNLLVGLAVGDIKDVQDQAQLKSNLLQIEADELLPEFIRRKFKKQRRLIFPNQLRLSLWWGKFVKKVWGAERSIYIIRKHKEVSYIEQAQRQTEQLAREENKLQTKMTDQLSREVKNLREKNSHMEQLQIELIEKNNRMEQLLVMMAEKQGIQWDPEESREIDRGEARAHSHP